MDLESLDLNTLLEGVTPPILTPKLNEVTEATNVKKPKVISDLIIRELHKKIEHTVTKDILHDGMIHKIRYFDIEPLMRGPWSQISLMLLQLSYNEQCTIIENIYPKELQLTAKAFAINFTNNTEKTIYIENDKEIVEKLDSANVGIATIMVMLQSLGGSIAHSDVVKKQMEKMSLLQDDLKNVKKFTNDSNRNDKVNKFRDLRR